MIILDGSHGEGGGQILRTALALSMITKKPFKIINIRKNRPTPGLKASHLAGINALCKISKSVCFGIDIGSEEIEFHPKEIEKFRETIDVETAGPVTLVMQTILPPLLFAEKESRMKIIGGTDVSWSPSIDYFSNVILPHLRRFADIKIKIEKRGYYPKGQGVINIAIKPKISKDYAEFDLVKQGNIQFVKGVSHASRDLIDADVCERQKKAAQNSLNKINCPIIIRTEYSDSKSTGSGITLFAGFSETDEINPTNPVILGADSLGKKGKKSEAVGEEASEKLLKEIDSGASCDTHLADNLIIFLAIAKGRINTSKITEHTLSCIHVAEQFLDVKFEIDKKSRVIYVS